MRDREAAFVMVALSAWFALTAAWWALALWPAPDGPAWLARTRYACFGVNENGLPDAGGWIALTAGPLGMLLILVVGWRAALARLLKRARTSTFTAAAFVTLGLGSAVLLTGAALRVQQARAADSWRDIDAVLPDQPARIERAAPPLTLTSQHDSVVSLTALAGRPVLVTFAYAHCETVCPLLVMAALQAQQQLIGTAFEPAVLIVTLDPWRDTPSALPTLARSWRLPADGAWVLSGTVADVQDVLHNWQVPAQRDSRTGQITHPALLYVVDRNGRLAYATARSGASAIVSVLRGL